MFVCSFISLISYFHLSNFIIEDAKNNKSVKNEAVVDDAISNNLLNEEINSNQTKLEVITSNRERIIAKKQMLLETLEKFNSLGK